MSVSSVTEPIKHSFRRRGAAARSTGATSAPVPPVPPVATAADIAEFLAWGTRLRRAGHLGDPTPHHRAHAGVRHALRAAPRAAFRAVARFGARVARDFGVTRARQFADVWWLGAHYGMTPITYYRLQLYLPERRGQWHLYLHDAGTSNLLRYLFAQRPSAERRALAHDKAYFASWCAERGFPAIGTVLSVGADAPPAPADALPAADLFTKPMNACQGQGARRWRALAGGRYVEDDGTGAPAESVDAAGLIDELQAQAHATGGAVVVQRVLENHAGLRSLSRGGLATVRLLTYCMPDAPAGVIGAGLRMPRGDAPVDNLAAGGLVAPVDVATGVLGAANTKHAARAGLRYAVHPDTGGVIAGARLPEWDAVVHLGLAAHDAVAAVVDGIPVIGWDVAITDDGPVLVELNTIPCVVGIQMTTGVPLGATPYVPAVLAQLRRLPAAAHRVRAAA